MNIKPLGDHILVKQFKKEEVTASGILLPGAAEDKKAEGEVIAVGPGKMLKSGERSTMEVVVGNKILFKKWGGDEVELGGEEYKIISQDDVLAIFE
ncbi:MAG: co-chaperone GroES [Candidatus Magasanikbacteria bacterium CG_4_10_14_0_2_um_filter_37_12]|uniref:Co-chaperonin GroES n=1 Tax=Candidatus Magasanikbacteria bacterium CG_4_10_14_0_2_um_filter_37_12 TaxID=1974637 RepID=A0A2M7V9R4_9BACT|nr:MAG: co-chaperone GroES [Candidatus Magasanikbacteria bacterium CG_4_10_14_0_2_um_filter_37_12]